MTDKQVNIQSAIEESQEDLPEAQFPEGVEELDAIDSLGAIVQEPSGEPLLQFVRDKVNTLQSEKKHFQDRCADLEHTLSIVQTAQSWSQGNVMTQEQAQKVKEMTMLLMQAKQAKEEAMSYSQVGPANLENKIRNYKNALRRERQEKKDMRERLVNAFAQAKKIKENSQRQAERHARERQAMGEHMRKMRANHERAMFDLRADIVGQMSASQGRMEHWNEFAGGVMNELHSLQEQLEEVKEEGEDTILGDDSANFLMELRVENPQAGNPEGELSLSPDEADLDTFVTSPAEA